MKLPDWRAIASPPRFSMSAFAQDSSASFASVPDAATPKSPRSASPAAPWARGSRCARSAGGGGGRSRRSPSIESTPSSSPARAPFSPASACAERRLGERTTSIVTTMNESARDGGERIGARARARESDHERDAAPLPRRRGAAEYDYVSARRLHRDGLPQRRSVITGIARSPRASRAAPVAPRPRRSAACVSASRACRSASMTSRFVVAPAR